MRGANFELLKPLNTMREACGIHRQVISCCQTRVAAVLWARTSSASTMLKRAIMVLHFMQYISPTVIFANVRPKCHSITCATKPRKIYENIPCQKIFRIPKRFHLMHGGYFAPPIAPCGIWRGFKAEVFTHKNPK